MVKIGQFYNYRQICLKTPWTGKFMGEKYSDVIQLTGSEKGSQSLTQDPCNDVKL